MRLSIRFHACPSGSHHCAVPSGFTCALQRELRKADIWCNALPHCVSVALALSFGPSSQLRLLWPLLTSRSADVTTRQRRPFKRKARSPRIRTMAFVAQPPDLRRFPLVARASRSVARSPWSATPHIRFLFVGSRLRYPASFSAALTARRLADHFGPCDQVPGGLPPPDHRPCRAYHLCPCSTSGSRGDPA